MPLIPLTPDDEDLAVRLECDAEMMRFIGGARSEADVRDAHKRRLDLMSKGEAFMYKIVGEQSDEAYGTIGFWRIDGEGLQACEMGWLVLPEYQRQGIATAAASELVAIARKTPGVRNLYAYPTVGNVASNKIAQKIGMKNQGEFQNDGFGGTLTCHRWHIDLLETMDS